MEQQYDFTIADLASKCRSKTELYNLLTREGKLYLPPAKDCTQKFLRRLMKGEKLYVSCSDVEVIKVPQYKGLKVSDILKFAATKTNINIYLPEYDYPKEPNREWVCNIVNSLIPEEFQYFIKHKEEIRRREILMSNNLGMKVNPEFLSIFKSSQAVSTVSGRSHFLTRDPKITYAQREIIQLKEERKEIDRKADSFKLEIKYLQDKLTKLENIERENEDNIEKLSKLYDAGIINEEGECIYNRDDQ